MCLLCYVFNYVFKHAICFRKVNHAVYASSYPSCRNYARCASDHHQQMRLRNTDAGRKIGQWTEQNNRTEYQLVRAGFSYNFKSSIHKGAQFRFEVKHAAGRNVLAKISLEANLYKMNFSGGVIGGKGVTLVIGETE